MIPSRKMQEEVGKLYETCRKMQGMQGNVGECREDVGKCKNMGKCGEKCRKIQENVGKMWENI